MTPGTRVEMAGDPPEVVEVAAYSDGRADVRFASGAVLANVNTSKWLTPVPPSTPLGPTGPLPEIPRLDP